MIESLNAISGMPTAAADCVAKSGISIVACGNSGVTVDTPAIFTGSVVCLRA